MSTVLSLDSLYHEIQPDLDRVKAAVEDHWTQAFRLVYGESATPPPLGGKLLRPALTLLSAGAVGERDTTRFVDMAVAMELLHLAALAHDDVVDRADRRRGNTSLNARWTNHMAVLGGDYLVARALTVLTGYDHCGVVASALSSIHDMAEGELINFGRGADNLGEEDCIRLAEKKTASLFAVSSCTPTLLLDGSYHDELHRYGMGLGTAFQLIDDVLDLDQTAETLGKPSCGDIIEGKSTLPILYLREELSAEDCERLDAFVDGEMTEADREWVSSTTRECGAYDRCVTLAQNYIANARTALSALPENACSSAMHDLTEFVVVRQA